MLTVLSISILLLVPLNVLAHTCQLYKECPPGWVYLWQFNKCFLAKIEATATWSEARADCRTLGGDLFIVNSVLALKTTVAAVNPLSGKNLWVGGHSSYQTDYTLEWIDGTEIDTTVFTYVQDDSSDTDQNKCLRYCNAGCEYNLTTAESCDDKLPYMCVTAQGACRSGYFYHQQLNTCYRIVTTQKKNWNNARAICQYVTGGDLIQVVSEDIHNFVVSSDTGTTWLGAKRHGTTDLTNFVWTKSNTPVSNYATFWANGEPNYSFENCLDIVGMEYPHLYRKWNDDKCRKGRNYICEHPV